MVISCHSKQKVATCERRMIHSAFFYFYMQKCRFIVFVFIISILIYSCKQDVVPRPRGYFRIDLPEKSFKPFENDCSYSFEIPDYAIVNNKRTKEEEECWLNIDFSRFKSTLHISYKEIANPNDLFQYTEDSRNLVYKHTLKASEIDEIIIRNPEDKVYGIVYEIGGNTASSMQFYLTDSTKHFVRGSLYFNTSPNIDSLSPVLYFIKQDVQHLINTLVWK